MATPEIFETDKQGDTLVVVARENVSGLAGYTLKAELDGLIEQFAEEHSRNIVIDLDRAGYFGTYMLELMQGLWQNVRRSHGKMALCNLSDLGMEILHVSRFDTLWPICPSREEALKAVAKQSGAEEPKA